MAGFADETRISGRLKLFAYPADTNSTPLRTAEFVVIQGSAYWQVTLTNFVYREGDGPLAIHYFSDGTSSTSVTYWPQAVIDREKVREVSKNPSMANDYKDVPTQNVRVADGHFPVGREFIEIAPWIEFCLPFYLNRGETNVIPNIFLNLAWPSNRIPSVTVYSAASKYPEHIIMWKPGIGYRSNAKHEVLEVALPKPYDNGYEGLKLDVTSWDDSGRMPQRFVETIYSVLPPSLGRSLEEPRQIVSVIVVGEVDNIKELIGEAKTTPALPVAAIVVDSRTNISTKPIAYKEKEFGILDVADPKLSEKVKNINGKLYAKAPVRNPYALAILVALLVAPWVMFWQSIVRRRKEK